MTDFVTQATAVLTQLQADEAVLARLLLPALLHKRSTAEAAALLAAVKPTLPDDVWVDVQQSVAISELLNQITDLFDRLRRQTGWVLGVAEFLQLLQALQTGLGQEALTDRAVLKELCQLLWAKSPLDQAILAHQFDQIISQSAAAPTDEETVEEASEQLPDDPIEPEPEPDDIEAQPKPTIEPAADEVEPIPEREVAKETAEQMMDSAPNRVFDTQDRKLAYQRFLLSTDYLPVTRRQLKQSWRYLRRQVRQGPPAEIDIPATVRRISEDGFFLTPAMRPRRTNKAALLLLIDQNGSMAPFHLLSRRLKETIESAGNLGQLGIYYFHDCPAVLRDGRIYTDLYREHTVTSHPQGLYARPISKILAEFDLNYSSVLIFSDAGAARGNWDDERIEATYIFLHQLHTLGVKNVVWLNPMPEDRWEATRLQALNLLEKFENSATAIADFVPMMSMERDGLYRAIDGLRGRI
ncbi:hypothetical protein MNBD_CHLOROFLEXI01-351 [hydrothermal vent metagenome]|uniref:Uncharacterized protein n=1 Tax=hydrothermal vent metagenome TaxID=652676 RepID=A0A3B0VS81_9ZZZZ